MAKNDNGNNSTQFQVAGRDAKQVGGNYRQNNNLFIGVFFVFVLALGGLALYIGFNQGEQNPKIEQVSPEAK